MSLELLALFLTKCFSKTLPNLFMEVFCHIISLKNQQQIQQSTVTVVLVVLQMEIVAPAEEVLLLTLVVKIVAGKERT